MTTVRRLRTHICMNHRKHYLYILYALCLITVFLILTGCGAQDSKYITCMDDMKDMSLSFGYPDDVDMKDLIYSVCPGASLSPQSDILAIDSVASGKLDCFAAERSYLEGYMKEHPDCGLTILNEPLVVFYSAFGLCDSTPINDYVGKVNRLLAEYESNGTLDDMRNRWFKIGDELMPDISMPENPEYTLRIATFGQQKPNTYIRDNQLTGYDIELALRVAAGLNCDVEFETASFPAMLMGMAEGKYDMIASNLYVTEERSENMSFSSPYFSSPISVIVRADPAAKKVINSADDLQTANRVGSVSGTIYEIITKDYFLDSEVIEYNSLMDAVTAIQNGKIDALLYDIPTLKYLIAEHSELKLLPENLMAEDYYFVSQRSESGKALADEFNLWLDERRTDGSLNEMEIFWTGSESPAGRICYPSQSSVRGTLVVGYDPGMRPDVFVYNNEPVGYPIELITRFCTDCGYGLELVPVRPDAFIDSLDNGNIDMFVALLSYTDNRAERVTYTEAILRGGVGALTRSDNASRNSRWESLSRSFQKTFINESRWKLLLSGFGVTLLITAGGFLLANMMGAAFCAMASSKHRALRTVEDIYSKIMQGTPVVVILMILYYVIFGKSRIGGIWVAIIGFGISSGAVLSQLFYGGINAVNRGQREASLALGFTKTQTFFGITLPQAIRLILPAYFSNLIALMKGTAIVGYIAVIDLTKSSDIVRSSTYEAFLPLITVGVVYFAIACILLSVMKSILKKLSPKRESAAVKEAGK